VLQGYFSKDIHVTSACTEKYLSLCLNTPTRMILLLLFMFPDSDVKTCLHVLKLPWHLQRFLPNRDNRRLL